MKSSLATFLAITAFLFVQCSEEEIRPGDKMLTAGISRSDISRTQGNTFKIGAMVHDDYDSEIAGYDYQFYLDGSGIVSINWGDGSSSVHNVGPAYEAVSHGYASPGSYNISISGDLKNITHVHSFYGMASFNAIDFKTLPNLSEVELGLTQSSKTIDLAHNSKLTKIFFAGMNELETVILPKKHAIKSISLDGPFNFDTQDIDGIIDNIHRNAVDNNLTGGYFTLPAEWWQEEGDVRMVGNPSAAALDKLRSLRDSYGWTIYPALDQQSM